MANEYFSNHGIHVEAVFGDTNNVCICSRAHLKDFYYRPKSYECASNYEEGHNSYTDALRDPSEDPEMPFENEFAEDYELMKSMGLPTSFGRVSKGHKNHKKYSYSYYDDYEGEEDEEEYYYEGDEEDDNYYGDEYSNEYYNDDYNFDECEIDSNMKIENNEVNFVTECFNGSKTKKNYSTSQSEIENDFENFWALHGDTIILNSWLQKYSENISPEYLKYYENELKVNIEKNTSNLNHNEDESNCDSALNNINNKFQSMSFSDTKDSKFVNDGRVTFFIDGNETSAEKSRFEDIELNFENYDTFSENMVSNYNLEDVVKNDFKTDQLEKAINQIESDSCLMGKNTDLNKEDMSNKTDFILDPPDVTKKYDEELESIKEKNPDLFTQKLANNMFACTVPEDSDENDVANKETLTTKTWEELWTIHCQEQYQYHYNLFFESNEKKNAGKSSLESNQGENEAFEALKCNLCGEYNCDFCIYDDYKSGVKVYNNDNSFGLFNTIISNVHIKEEAKCFWNDHKTILAYPLKDYSISMKNPPLPDNIFALDCEFDDSLETPQAENDSVRQGSEGSVQILQSCDDALKIQQGKNSDDEPPTELPIKRMHEEESESEEPADLIKELGLVIRPTLALKIKRNKRRKLRKSYNKFNKACIPVEDIQKDVTKTQENEEKNIDNPPESFQANNYELVPTQNVECKELNKVDYLKLNSLAEGSDNIIYTIEKDPAIKKYWHQRYRLFYRFDDGIKLDKESWFSVTPERIAQHTAKRCACPLIIDAFCGAGGNAIQFAFTCSHVIAMDIDPKKIELAKHNAMIYGVADKIEFIVGDYLKLAPSLRADGVFLSPPWGGPEYAKDAEYDIVKIEPNIYETFEVTRRITQNIALFVPKNTIINQLVKLSGDGNSVEIEQNFLNKKVKTLTAYYGNFVNHPNEDDSKEDCES